MTHFFSSFNKPYFLYVVSTGPSTQNFYILKGTIFVFFFLSTLTFQDKQLLSLGKILCGCYLVGYSSDVLFSPGISILTESWILFVCMRSIFFLSAEIFAHKIMCVLGGLNLLSLSSWQVATEQTQQSRQ